MTTPNERDRFEAWAKDTMSLVKEPGGYKEATTHHAWRAWQAALTREQRENDAIAAAFREVTGPNGASISNDEIADYITQRSKEIMANAPQQEAPGAVASVEDAGEFHSDTAALAFLRLIGNGNPNIERAVDRLHQSLTTPQPRTP